MNQDYSFPVHPYWIDYSALYKRADAINHAYHSGNLVFFIGSGASKAFCSPMPSWNELMTALLSEVKIQNQTQKEEIIQHIKSQRYLLAGEAIKNFGTFDTDRRDLAVDGLVAKILRQRLNSADNNPVLHLSILDFSVPIFTTNFDNIIEKLVSEYDIKGYKKEAITYEDQEETATLLNPTKIHENYIFKLHGSVDKTQRLILDDADYTDFYFHGKWATSLQILRHVLSTKMVIFLGFSLSDPEIMLILREATRYSSSYQHIALLESKTLSSIEKDILRLNYRVDPITYDKHELLPLYVMEMRNFYHREDTALHLRKSKPTLLEAVNKIRSTYQLDIDSSAILFGSYAKYGNLSQVDADIDILFLTQQSYYGDRHLSSSEADQLMGRKVDITVMQRDELEKLLQKGDAFASSILVTGCPLEDPDDIYGILCRGFKGNYKYRDVLGNALNRYQTRWMRLCLLEKLDLQEYLLAFHQWYIGLMQLFIIKDYYPLDSLIGMSLLGNARYVIREFANRFQDFDEKRFLTLMQAAKGIVALDESIDTTIDYAVQELFLVLKGKYPESELEMLKPGSLIPKSTSIQIVEIYNSLRYYLTALSSGKTGIALGYGGFADTEISLLTTLDRIQKEHGRKLTTFDDLFFMRLHNMILLEKEISETRMIELSDLAKNEWVNYISKLRFGK